MKKNIFKKLFVIHNLECFVETEQEETIIDYYWKYSSTLEIKDNYYIEFGKSNLINENQNNKFYDETFEHVEESPLQGFYLVIANDFYEAGKYYNGFSINY